MKVKILLLIMIVLLGTLLRYSLTDWGKAGMESRIHYKLAGDEVGYDKTVRQLLEKKVYGYEPYGYSETANAFTTPGYPLFLAACYLLFGYGSEPPIVYIQIVQNLLDVCSGILLFLICRTLFKDWFVACAVLFLYMVHPTFIYSASYLLTETLYGFAAITFVYMLVTFIQGESRMNRKGLLLGLAFGLTILIRPVVLPFIIPLIGLVAIRLYRSDMKLKPVLLIVLGFAFVMAPWWVRNYISLHKWVWVAEQAGNPLLFGTFPYNDNPQIDVGTDPQLMKEQAIARIVSGFRTEPWLYLKWYTVGKSWYLIKDIYVGFQAITNPLLLKLHYLIVFTGFGGLILSPFARSRERGMRFPFLAISIFAAISFLAYLPFAPTSRYLYSALPLCLIGVGYLLLQVRKLQDKIEGPSSSGI